MPNTPLSVGGSAKPHAAQTAIPHVHGDMPCSTPKQRRVSLPSSPNAQHIPGWPFRDEMGLPSQTSGAGIGFTRSSSAAAGALLGDVQRTKRARRKWSVEETQMLVEGCNRHGVGNWKDILCDARLHFEPARTPMDLKDRFRTYFPDAYRQCYPNAKTHLSTRIRSSLADGSPLFEKTRNKRRRAFSVEEDTALRRGYEKHGTLWAQIVQDPIFQCKQRRSTDLRDRFRNAFPDLYEAAGYKPRTTQKKAVATAVPCVNAVTRGTATRPPQVFSVNARVATESYIVSDCESSAEEERCPHSPDFLTKDCLVDNSVTHTHSAMQQLSDSCRASPKDKVRTPFPDNAFAVTPHHSSSSQSSTHDGQAWLPRMLSPSPPHLELGEPHTNTYHVDDTKSALSALRWSSNALRTGFAPGAPSHSSSLTPGWWNMHEVVDRYDLCSGSSTMSPLSAHDFGSTLGLHDQFLESNTDSTMAGYPLGPRGFTHHVAGDLIFASYRPSPSSPFNSAQLVDNSPDRFTAGAARSPVSSRAGHAEGTSHLDIFQIRAISQRGSGGEATSRAASTEATDMTGMVAHVGASRVSACDDAQPLNVEHRREAFHATSQASYINPVLSMSQSINLAFTPISSLQSSPSTHPSSLASDSQSRSPVMFDSDLHHGFQLRRPVGHVPCRSFSLPPTETRSYGLPTVDAATASTSMSEVSSVIESPYQRSFFNPSTIMPQPTHSSTWVGIGRTWEHDSLSSLDLQYQQTSASLSSGGTGRLPLSWWTGADGAARRSGSSLWPADLCGDTLALDLASSVTYDNPRTFTPPCKFPSRRPVSKATSMSGQRAPESLVWDGVMP